MVQVMLGGNRVAKPIKYTISDGKLVLTLEPVEEGGYLVTSPLHPDVLTQADSIEEAFEMARDVIALFEEDRTEERSKRTKRRSNHTVRG
jgi:predicted RNase H-like HicB family nuclease